MKKICIFLVLLTVFSISIFSCAAPQQETKPPAETTKTPASFTVADLTVTPGTVNQGDSVTISVTVKNSGETAGEYAAVLKINGAQEATQNITLEGGASKKLDFPVSRSDAGDYSVGIESLTGKFTVTASAPATKSITISDSEFTAISHELTGKPSYDYTVHFLNGNKMYVKSMYDFTFDVAVCDGKFCLHQMSPIAWDYIYSKAHQYFTFTDQELMTMVACPDSVTPKLFAPGVKGLPTIISITTQEGSITITFLSE